MYKQILIAIDGSELAAKVLEHGLALARFSGAKVKAVTVTEPSVLLAPNAEMITVSTAELLEELERVAEEDATTILARASAAADTVGVKVEVEHIRRQHPSDGIVHTAEAEHADLIVMGSHGRRGLGRLLLGSQASEVLSRSKVPVLIVR
ncbi:MAG: universal stress protein [Hyphomicrobiales bacterium]|nr:MAG: universal stress protein [Hyphomicrobiales bacterium]